MSNKNPKAKGNSWERELSKILSLWWSNNKDKYVFFKSVNSGAWGNIHKKEGVKSHSGDIEAVDEKGKIFTKKVYIETKWYNKENSLLYEVLLNKKLQILKWWSKTEKEALDVNKYPILIVKFNFKNPFIVLPHFLYTDIYKYSKSPPNNKSLIIINMEFNNSIYNQIVIMDLNVFLKWCKPDYFKR